MIHYANSNLDLRHVDRYSMDAFKKCSFQWHKLLDLEQGVEDEISIESLWNRIAKMEKST